MAEVKKEPAAVFTTAGDRRQSSRLSFSFLGRQLRLSAHVKTYLDWIFLGLRNHDRHQEEGVVPFSKGPDGLTGS